MKSRQRGSAGHSRRPGEGPATGSVFAPAIRVEQAAGELEPLAMAVADLDGRLIRVNDAFVALWRLPDQESALGRRVDEFWQNPTEASRVVDVLENEHAWHGEMTARRDDGTSLELEVSACLMLGADGAPLYLTASFLDVTDRRRAAAAVWQSEERFRRVFEQGTFAMAMSDRDFRFYKVNEAFCKLFGYSEAELAEITFRDITHPDQLAADIENVTRLLRGEISVYQTEKRYITKSGQVIWGALTLSVLRDTDGSFLHFLVLIENIDERRRAQRALLDAQRLESLAVLAGGIAHDFNNLLLGVFGHIELARREIGAGSIAAEYLDEALSVAQQARSLTQQLLTFAKGGAPRKESLELRELLERVTRWALSGSNVRFRMVIADDLWHVDADQDQLARAIENVLINARQAMPLGGAVAVTARNRAESESLPPLVEPGRYVSIAIEDRGGGIPEEVLRHVFDPFFTTKPEGSGLGLSTAFSIVKRHGGHIEARSELGRGATFELLLPAATRATAKKSEPRSISRSRPRSVLVVDDEPVVRLVASEILRSFGHSVELAEDCEQAVERYRTALAAGRRFDVVVLDLVIPGGPGGRAVLEELSALDPQVVAVASSGYSDDPVIADPARFGFRGSLAKPYVGDQLLAAIDAACSSPGIASDS